MIKKNYKMRWIYVAFGILALIYAGVLNAWSTIAVPIEQEFTTWNKAKITLIYTIAQSVFCIAGMIGGFTANKFTSRKTMIFSGFMILAGCLIASCTSSLLVFCLTFGVLAGGGMGLVYNAVVRALVRWFPEKSGLISGVLLLGYGMSGFITGKVYQAFTPSYIGGWRASFRFIGISAIIVLLITSQFVLEPGPEDLPAGAGGKAAEHRPDEYLGEYTPAQAFRCPALYIYYCFNFCLSVTGCSLLSQGTGIATEIAPAMSAASIATIVGLMPFANGCGRIISGYMVDRLRVFKTMLYCSGMFSAACVLFLIALKTGLVPAMILAFLCTGLGFGSLAPLNSSYSMTRFGMTYYAVMFAFMNTAGVPSSMTATAIGALYDSTGTYFYPVLVLLGCSVLGIIVRFILQAYEKRLHKA